MIITISGRAGSGKSTVAKLLAQRLKLKHYSMGDLTREIAKEKNVSILELSKMQEKEPSIDKDIDKRQIEIGKEEDNFVIDGRLSAFFIPHADFKIFLDADEKVRGERILREARSLEKSAGLKDTLIKLKAREESEIKRYKEYYNFDCYDKNRYDIVINTTELTPEHVVDVIIKKINDKKNSPKGIFFSGNDKKK